MKERHIKLMNTIFEKGWDIEFRLDTKRMEGEWVARYVWELVINGGHIECDWEGFETSEEMLDDLAIKILEQ